MAQTPACAKVFDVLELAEQILLDIPLSDLLCNAQRTCKQWQSTISHSLVLQQALFIIPSGREPLIYTSGFTRDTWSEQNSGRAKAVIENPLITRVLQSQLHANVSHTLLSGAPKIDKTAVMRPEASWRRMLVSQPPIAEATISRKSEYGDVEKTNSQSRNGLTMGELDIPLLNKYEMAAFSIAGWYLWEACSLQDEARNVRARMRQR